MKEMPPTTVVPDTPEAFLAHYADKNFLDDFEKQYSEDDADKMLLNIRDIIKAGKDGNEKEIHRAKDALSWSSELRHQYS